jgi:magnesium transporter
VVQRDETVWGVLDQMPRKVTRALTAPVLRAVTKILSADAGATVPAPVRRDGSSIVDCAVYAGGVRQPGELSYEEAAAKASEKSFVWLGLHEPGAEELAAIGAAFGVFEFVIEDALMPGQRPKIERYGELTVIVLRTARYVEHAELTDTSDVVETGHIILLVAKHYVISVRLGNAARLAPVRAQLEAKPEQLKQGPWAVAQAVVHSVVNLYADVAHAIEHDVDAIEELAFGERGTTTISHIYQLKRELMEFKRTVLPLQRPLTGLLSGEDSPLPRHLLRPFRLTAEHLARAVEQVGTYDDLLNSILQARLAQVTVDQNNDMRKIAAWAAIVAVQTTIAGVYGMNFAVIPGAQSKYGFVTVVGIMLVCGVVFYRYLRRAGWL